MRQNQLVLVSIDVTPETTVEVHTRTLTESLWDTVKNQFLNIILREPALIELASRKDPGVIPFCENLLRADDQESWFTALKALETLSTYDASQRLLVLCGTSNTGDRKIVLNVLARVLSSPQREGFRRLIRSVVSPGELDVSNWTPTALRVLEAVCAEKGVQIVDPAGLPLSNLGQSLQPSVFFDTK